MSEVTIQPTAIPTPTSQPTYTSQPAGKDNYIYSMMDIERDLKDILSDVETFKQYKPLEILPTPAEMDKIIELLDKHKDNDILIFDDTLKMIVR